ncbi:MAG TPA: hypothetical protein VGS09_06880 [Actinomycetota bacterium]|nr:hypothetical protein [Actinomycetota bacterium]
MAKAPRSRARQPAESVRPLAVLAAGILFILYGAFLTVLGGALFLFPPTGPDTSSAPVIGLGFALFLGLPLIITGVMVVRLSNAWRIVGMVLSGLAIFGTLQGLGNEYTLTSEGLRPEGLGVLDVLFLAGNAFIIGALIRYRGAFRRRADRGLIKYPGDSLRS